MTTKVTMTDTAYKCMSKRKKEVEFARLWQEVAKSMKIPEEQLTKKKRQFYADLMKDHRFTALKGNKWDLRSRHSYDEVNKEGDYETTDDEDEDSDDIADRDTLDLPKGDEAY